MVVLVVLADVPMVLMAHYSKTDNTIQLDTVRRLVVGRAKLTKMTICNQMERIERIQCWLVLETKKMETHRKTYSTSAKTLELDN